MLSRRCERTLHLTLAALISLTLVTTGPILKGNVSYAAEIQNSVDVIQCYYDLNDAEFDEIPNRDLANRLTEIILDEEFTQDLDENSIKFLHQDLAMLLVEYPDLLQAEESDAADVHLADTLQQLLTENADLQAALDEANEAAEEDTDSDAAGDADAAADVDADSVMDTDQDIEEDKDTDSDAADDAQMIEEGQRESGQAEAAETDEEENSDADEDADADLEDMSAAAAEAADADADDDADREEASEAEEAAVQEVAAEVAEEETEETEANLTDADFVASEAAQADDSVAADADAIDEEDASTKDVEAEVNTDLDGAFPASYQPLVEALQAAHPNWNFVPVETGVDWDTAVDAQDHGSTSLVSKSEPASYRASSDKTYDGGLYRANRATISYYMDPRNFLDEDSIFQFLKQSYDAESQNVDTVAAVIEGSFMEEAAPGGDFETYAACIEDAGEDAGVNANVLAAMIIQEQGWKGSRLSDGETGVYNFFNIGAYTAGGMSNVERGLWYAGGEGEGKDSYARPWNEPYKAILGGAQFYCENYIDNAQDTYYTKKFNVLNGAEAMGTHQYMTNIYAANEEGKLVKRAYADSDVSATFEIPVYQNMPVDPAQLP